MKKFYILHFCISISTVLSDLSQINDEAVLINIILWGALLNCLLINVKEFFRLYMLALQPQPNPNNYDLILFTCSTLALKSKIIWC